AAAPPLASALSFASLFHPTPRPPTPALFPYTTLFRSYPTPRLGNRVALGNGDAFELRSRNPGPFGGVCVYPVALRRRIGGTMDIVVTGRHCTVGTDLKSLVNDRLTSVEKFKDRLIRGEVEFSASEGTKNPADAVEVQSTVG